MKKRPSIALTEPGFAIFQNPKNTLMNPSSLLPFSLAPFACLFVVVFGLSENTIAQENRPLKIFILAGQSNMQGQGVVDLDDQKDYNGGKGNLVWSIGQSASKDMMRHLQDADGNWVEREDVFVRYQTENELKTGGLTIGYSGYSGRHHIGLELQFGHVVGDYFEQPVLLVKTCWGGKSLFKDFRPPSADGETGEYYLKMVAETREALDRVGEDFPQLKPVGHEIAGFVWMQGWNDMIDQGATAEYAANLVHLVQDVRAEFELPNLPVVIGELGNGGDPPFGEKGEGQMLKFRRQQRLGAEQIENARFVITHEFARPAELSPNVGHGHHWFGNAESYFLVGDALGKAMIDLFRGK